MRNKLHTILIIAIFSLAFLLRFNQLSAIPPGLEQDETSIGYNAYSILTTGKDEYGKSFPLYFKAFGEYKLPGYIYLTTIPISIFGLNEFSIRFTSALFGSLTIIAFYFLLKIIFGKKKPLIPTAATFLLAINPWHLHFSRGAFEVTLALFFIVFATLLFLLSVKKNNLVLLLLSLIFFVFSIYTYNIARLFTPVLAGFLLFQYRKEKLLRSKLSILLVFSLITILLLPFIINFFNKGGLRSAEGTILFSSMAIKAPIIEFRSYLMSAPSLFTKTFFNTWVLMFWTYINNIASYLSVQFLFISGSLHGNHGIGNIGQFYLFELPLVVIGIYKAIKEKIDVKYFLIFWAIIIILIASLTRETPYATRSFFLIIPFEIFSGIGLISLFNYFKKKGKVKYFFYVLFGGLVFYSLIYYFSSYYFRFPILYAKAWRQEDKDVSKTIDDIGGKYNSIIFDTNVGFTYSSFLFYAKYPPANFQQTVVRLPDDSEGFSNVESFGKYSFKKVDWEKDYKLPKTLIVSSIDNKPSNIPALKTFNYPKKPIVLSLGQEIIQYPVEENAYVLVETK